MIGESGPELVHLEPGAHVISARVRNNNWRGTRRLYIDGKRVPMKTHTVYRSAVDGRYVSKAYAERHPETTVAERVGPVRALIARLTVKP